MADPANPAHLGSRRTRDECLRARGILLTTDYIIDEPLIRIRIRIRLALRAVSAWGAQIEGSSRLQREWIDPTRADKARTWFFQWKDKDFSFTDGTRFVGMKELRVRRALTTDRHFRQAGFEMVP